MTDPTPATAGSRALPNHRQEAFSQALARHAPSERAYREAGYTGGDVARKRVQALPHVKARVAYLVAQIASERHDYDLDQWLRQQIGIAHFDPISFYDDKFRLRDLSTLSVEARRQIVEIEWAQEMVYDPESGGHEPVEYIKRIKFTDRQKAITELGRYLGAFEKDNIQRRAVNQSLTVQGDVYLESLPDSRLMELRAEIEAGEEDL
jgi:hypothetical protein